MDIQIQQKINEAAFSDYMRLDQILGHRVLVRLEMAFNEPILPKLFKELLRHEWFKYSISN